ncbi:MAG: hypothetical protein KY467_03420 [Gemmatimonadetes bacterium]|nr:hypothetical protein [Gemmatimonadota bacterium]
MSGLPPALAEWIQRRIDELPADGDAAWLRRICKERLNALPLSGDQVYLWALRPDGTVLCLDHEAFRLPVHDETDPATLYRVLREAAVLYPELQPLVPPPPPASRTAPVLAGEPRPLAEPGRRELLDVLLEARGAAGPPRK